MKDVLGCYTPYALPCEAVCSAASLAQFLMAPALIRVDISNGKIASSVILPTNKCQIVKQHWGIVSETAKTADLTNQFVQYGTYFGETPNCYEDTPPNLP